MSVTTTRRIADLREECSEAGIVWQIAWSREQLMDSLRLKFGAFDKTTQIDPMKAQPTKHLVTIGENGPDYSGISHLLTDQFACEPKLDGARMRMFVGLSGSTLNTGRRNVKTFAYTDRSANFPHLSSFASENLAGVILDGELLAPSSRIQTHTGLWTSSLLNASVALTTAKPAGSVATQGRFGPATFYAFDVLAVKDMNTDEWLNEPYWRRRLRLKAICNEIAQTNKYIKIVESRSAAKEHIDSFIAAGYEGAMLKDVNSPYLPGKRKHWWKIKNNYTADGFIIGFTPGKERNEGLVGSITLAVMGGTAEYVEVAQCGNLTDSFRDEITDSDGTLKPEWYNKVIEFSGQGVTATNKKIRHPYMVRCRPDKEYFDCGFDQLDNFPVI